MDKQTRQIIAFHVGDRSHERAQQLWANLPAVYREQATFYPDQYAVYTGIMPAANTKPSQSKRAKPTTSSVSTTRCGGASPVSSGTLWPSPKSWRIISGPSNTSYAITTCQGCSYASFPCKWAARRRAPWGWDARLRAHDVVLAPDLRNRHRVCFACVSCVSGVGWGWS